MLIDRRQREERRRSERRRVVFGLRPRTLGGWWFWLRYWSPVARWWRRVQ